MPIQGIVRFTNDFLLDMLADLQKRSPPPLVSLLLSENIEMEGSYVLQKGKDLQSHLSRINGLDVFFTPIADIDADRFVPCDKQISMGLMVLIAAKGAYHPESLPFVSTEGANPHPLSLFT